MAKKSKRDRIIESMWQNLPSNCVESLRDAVEDDLGETVTYPMIAQCITYLRKHAEHYGWTIPHSPRGPVTDSSDLRLFGLELKSPKLTSAERGSAEQGAGSTLRSIMSQSKHQADTLEAMMAATPAPALKRIYKQMRNEQLHIANLAETALEALAA